MHAHHLRRKTSADTGAGASDARLYRLHGLASVVCGLTPYNLGGPDKYFILEDLYAVGYMHTLVAFEFLAADPA